MLKKVMIICIALSFVFIGGIAFASGNQPEPPQKDTIIQELEEITPPADPTDLIADEVKDEVDEVKDEVDEVKDEVDEVKDNVLELKDKIMEEGDNGHN